MNATWGYKVKDTNWTDGPGAIYLHVFYWPFNCRLEVPRVENRIEQAYILSDPQRTPMKIETQDPRLIIHMPEDQPEGPSWVVVLKVDGEPRARVQ